MTIVLVTGGRTYDDADQVARSLSAARPSLIIHGAARGADSLADAWARANGIRVEACPAARWRDRDGCYDPGAGIKRNATMLEDWHPDVVVAFPGGRGTADMVRRARRAGVQVLEVSEWDALLG